VSGGGSGVVSHAGLALLRRLADVTGLTAGLSKALASRRLLVHDRGRVLSDLACAIADGALVIADFRVMGDQRELFGPVASVPTLWRALEESAAGGERTAKRVTAAVNHARRAAWGGSRPGMVPCRRCGYGQDPGRGDLHPAGRDGHHCAQRQGGRRAELQGLRPSSAAGVL
jgi:hypothetical protein